MESATHKDLKGGNEPLQRCCELRGRLYELLRKSMEEGSRAYDAEMKQLHDEITLVMAKIDS